MAIDPGGAMRAMAQCLQAYFAGRHATGSTATQRDRMPDFDGLDAVLGTPGTLARGQACDAGIQGG